MAFLAPPGVPGCLRDLEKNCKNSQKIYKKLTCIKIPQIIALRPILGYLDYPGGPQGGQKVIWWCKKFFLAESIWSFRQNTLYLSQVSGLGGHGPWFWLLEVPIGLPLPPKIYLSIYSWLGSTVWLHHFYHIFGLFLTNFKEIHSFLATNLCLYDTKVKNSWKILT